MCQQTKPQYTYRLRIERVVSDREFHTMLDLDITADEAIDIMREKSYNVEIYGVPMETNSEDSELSEEESEPESEEEESSDDDEESEDDEPEPSHRGRQASWDKDRAKEMINAGEKAGDIADEVGASIGSIYQLKTDMKKAGELTLGKDEAPEPEEEDEPEPEPTPKLRNPEHNPDDDQRTKQLKALYRRLPDKEKAVVITYKDSKDRSHVLSKHPDVEVSRIDDLISAYGDLDL